MLDTNERGVGLRDGQVITVDTHDLTIGSNRTVVRTTDATGVQRVLGTINTADVTGIFGNNSVSGNTLIVAADTALQACRLPTSGPLSSSFPDPTHWLSGDIRPKQAADLCTAITPATTRAFGFVPPTRAAPASCGWVETTASNKVVQLGVESKVSTPIATSTAVQDAHSLFVRLAKPDGVSTRPAMTPVAGLGDEAQTNATTTPGPAVTIIVRRVNVVVTANASSDSYGQNQKKVLAQLQHALRLAAQDIVAELDRRH